MVYIIILAATYFLASYLIGPGWAALVALFFTQIITFYIKRRSWEKKILTGLPEQQQDLFFRSIGRGNALIEQMIEHRRKRSDIIKHVMISAIDGLVDLSVSERCEVLDLYEKYGSNPLDRDFVMNIYLKFSGKYNEKFEGFTSQYQGRDLTSSITLERMYRWVIKLNIKFINKELETR